jgi:hypothetical protein
MRQAIRAATFRIRKVRITGSLNKDYVFVCVCVVFLILILYESQRTTAPVV